MYTFQCFRLLGLMGTGQGTQGYERDSTWKGKVSVSLRMLLHGTWSFMGEILLWVLLQGKWFYMWDVLLSFQKVFEGRADVLPESLLARAVLAVLMQFLALGVCSELCFVTLVAVCACHENWLCPENWVLCSNALLYLMSSSPFFFYSCPFASLFHWSVHLKAFSYLLFWPLVENKLTTTIKRDFFFFWCLAMSYKMFLQHLFYWGGWWIVEPLSSLIVLWCFSLFVPQWDDHEII